MKTSNKILIGAISILGLSLLSVLIFAKSSLINIKENTVNGDGNIVRITHELEDISKLAVDDFFEVYIKKGEPSLVIETDENIQALIFKDYDHFRYNDNKGNKTHTRRLRVRSINDIQINPTQAIKLFLAVPSLDQIKMDSHASVTLEDPINSESMEISAHEFAKLKGTINTDRLIINTRNHAELDINGKIGDTTIEAKEFANIKVEGIEAESVFLKLFSQVTLDIKGNTKQLEINNKEFCKIYAQDLVADDIKLDADTQSEIYVHAEKTLEATVNEFSHVKYRGNPELIKYVDKMGSLEKMED